VVITKEEKASALACTLSSVKNCVAVVLGCQTLV